MDSISKSVRHRRGHIADHYNDIQPLLADYDADRVLGYTARDPGTNTKVFLKYLAYYPVCNTYMKKNSNAHCINELQLLQECQSHPGLVKSHKTFFISSRNECWIEMEFIAGGTFRDLRERLKQLHHDGHHEQVNNILVHVYSQCFAIVKLLHDKYHISHMDMEHLGNWMLDTTTDRVIMIDLGMARRLTSDSKDDRYRLGDMQELVFMLSELSSGLITHDHPVGHLLGGLSKTYCGGQRCDYYHDPKQMNENEEEDEAHTAK